MKRGTRHNAMIWVANDNNGKGKILPANEEL